ncbi:NlpC/P60 family protein [Corynebacterium sp. 4HC-13]|uniref:NlpC/P60 family protein n=2 Tax=Corynebacterium anserum TaxID=2684406 RepID=A0A7G7YR95_9CORY|nr:NlpC/P60 family protein [Corynebacterium anserum]QNH97015.1 NlpC/P60 family protein [Corynebacterium anserum]
MSTGASALITDLDTPEIHRLVPAIRSTLQGIAGDDVARKLDYATHAVTHLLDRGKSLDGIAKKAARSVELTIEDITEITHRCIAEVTHHLLHNPPSAGPSAFLAIAGVTPIVEAHKLQAQARLASLARDMQRLTHEVTSLPTTDTPELNAPVSPASYSPTGSSASNSSDYPGTRPSSEADGLASNFSGNTSGAPTPQAAAAVEAAKSALGTPYQWGGTTPGVGMDCSGLTQWAYAQAGVEIPRMADQQAVGAPVSMDQLAPGDLAVWDGHVAMYIGDGQIIEAGDPVQISPVRTNNMGMSFLGFYRPTA